MSELELCKTENNTLKKYIIESEDKYINLLNQASQMKIIFNNQNILFILLILLLIYLYKNSKTFN